VTKSGNVYTDAMLGDYKWATTSLTYSFPTSASFYGSPYGNGETASFGTLNSAQQTAAKAALAGYAAVANLTFTQLTESASKHADLRMASSDRPSTAWAYFPTTAAEGGDAWFNKSSGYYSNPVKGNYAYTTFLHEIGHALGLEHPHENGMAVERDSMEFTVMSYRSYIGAPLRGYVNESWGYAQSLMQLDIAAVQQMYGANFNTNAGSTTYSWSPTTGEMSINGVGQGAPGGNRIFMTVWDGGGVDTYDFSRYATNLTVDLNPGAWSTSSSAQLARLHYNGSQVADGNIANALLYKGDLRSLIENAKGGAGADSITGNQADNALWGNGGNDQLSGNNGNDVLIGGAGGDRLDGGAGIDTASYEEATAGVVASLSNPGSNTGEAAGDTFYFIEQLKGSNNGDTLSGDDTANALVGLSGNDTLDGRGGNDVLTGGAGADTMTGGAGADTFVFAAVADSRNNGGRDTITDFISKLDRIDLRAIDANTRTSGDQAFSYIGSAAFSGLAGQLHYVNGVLEGDTNGDRVADFQIVMQNVGAFATADFIL
jgi:serralysin